MVDYLPLEEVQIGGETVWGTPVTPTAKIMGVEEDVEIEPVIEAEAIAELRGSYQPAYSAPLRRVYGKAKLPMAVTYEDIIYLLDGIDEATPVGVGPHTRDYSAPAGTAPAPRLQTIVKGNPTRAYGLAGAVVSELEISGEVGEPIMAEATFVGKQVNDDALAALSDRAVTVAMGDHIALFIDAVGGAIGTTAISTTWFSFKLKIDTKRSVLHGLGSLLPSTYTESERWEAELELALAIDATTAAYLTSILAASSVLQHQIRMKATSGTNILQLDFAGFLEEAPPLGDDEDGVNIIEMTYKGIYNAALGNFFKAQVVNDVDVLA